MFKVFKYSLSDLIRSRWMYIYLVFFLIAGFGLLYLSSDLSKAIASLMNVVIILCPLVAILFGTLYYYNSREFIELLLALPLKRRSIFLGKYLGLSTALTISFLAGTIIPFSLYGIFISGTIWDFSMLLLSGVMLTFIFTSLAFMLAMLTENPIRGFGVSIFTWLLLAVVYDGILLLTMILFDSYPLENYALVMTFFNPIDLSRILIMLQLDLSALMGYTGAVFNKVLGSGWGKIMAIAAHLAWIAVPLTIFLVRSGKKDF